MPWQAATARADLMPIHHQHPTGETHEQNGEQGPGRWRGAVVLVAAACGSDSSSSSAAPDGVGGSGHDGVGGAATAAPAEAPPRRPAATLKPVKLQLQWFTQAQFAGYFAAMDQGFYKDAGPRRRRSSRAASTSCRRPCWPRATPTSPSPGCPRRSQSREQGAGITDIAQIFQRSGTLQVSFKDKNITDAADFEGQEGRQLGLRQRVRALRRHDQGRPRPGKRRRRSCSSSSTCRRCSSGDIDAAQAMIYNEYAQVLEAKNPATGQAVHAGGLQRHQLATTSAPACSRTPSGPTPTS